jgi:hypothetical protein
MDLMASLRILRMRWILTSTLLLLTLVATGAAAYVWPRSYLADATTVLLASKNSAKLAGGNPYLVFNSSLTLTADVVRREVGDPRTGLSLTSRGYTASYTVVAAPDTSGPVLLITVTGKSKANVESTLHAVADEVGTKLSTLQAGITPDNQITDLILSMSPTATLSLSKMARPLVVILGFGLALTFFIPQIVDAQASRRRARRRNPQADGDDVSDSGKWGSNGSQAADIDPRDGAAVGADVSTAGGSYQAARGYKPEPEHKEPSARGRLR